jgi:hypothetical protein
MQVYAGAPKQTINFNGADGGVASGDNTTPFESVIADFLFHP